MKEQLILEHVTPETITCDQSVLSRVIRRAMEELADYSDMSDIDQFLDWSSLQELEELELTESQYVDIQPWLNETIERLKVNFDKLKDYVERDHDNCVEGYVKSDDYVSGYSYLADEGDWRKEELVSQLEDILAADYPEYWKHLEDSGKFDEFFDGFADHLRFIGYDYATVDSCYANPPKNFIAVSAFPVGDYEDQVEVSTLVDRLDLLPCAQSELIELLEILDQQISSKDKHPYFYMHTNTDIIHYYGWTIIAINSALEEYLEPVLAGLFPAEED